MPAAGLKIGHLTVLVENNPFGFQRAFLPQIIVTGKRYFPVAINHPMPGKPAAFREAFEYAANLTCGAWRSGELGYFAIRRDFPLGNGGNDMKNALAEVIAFRCH